MYRQLFCLDGSDPDPRNHRAKVPAAPRARSSGCSVGVHYAAAPAWSTNGAEVTAAPFGGDSRAKEPTCQPSHERRLEELLLRWTDLEICYPEPACSSLPAVSRGRRSEGPQQMAP